MLFGREDACVQLRSLLTSLREGRGGTLVLQGPAGIGKTTLLEYAATQAQGLRVLRARGVPHEVGIPYAGLSQLLAPLVELLPSLSAPQADALAAALAIGPSAGSDAPVYAGTLSLLANAASQCPLLLLVDDAQWLDAASSAALLFAQRRLLGDPVLVLLTFRVDPSLPPPPIGLPALELGGLDDRSAAALLEHAGYRVDAGVLGWLVRATDGNPLALQDLPTYVASRDLADLALRAAPAPIGPALLAAYGQAIDQLPQQTQRALLIAALLDDASVIVLRRALRFAGLAWPALEPAEDVGLLTLTDGVLRMRHPLVRSAVLQSASPSQRRAAHRAAADGLLDSHRPHDASSRVWQLAAAVVGPDGPTARLLEELAHSALERAGYAAACLTLQRAAELSEPGPDRNRRLLAAAEAAFTAGQSTDCSALLERLSEQAPAFAQDPAVQHLQGRLETWSGSPPLAARRLLSTAAATRHSDPALALRLAADGTVAAVLAGRMQQAWDAASLTAAIAPPLGPAALPLSDLLVGSVRAMRGDGNAARQNLDRCTAAFTSSDITPATLPLTIHLATAYSFIDAFAEAGPLFERALELARGWGAVGLLPFGLAQAAVVAYRTGAWEVAYARAHEAVALAEDCGRTTDLPNARAVLAMIDAGRGRDSARDHAEAAVRQAGETGARFIEAQGYSMAGLLELSAGRPEAAIVPLTRCGELATELGLLELGHLQWAAELTEALCRTGRPARAGAPLQALRRGAHRNATALTHALLARCEAMTSTDGSWEEHFRAALGWHTRAAPRPFELARTQLVYGERLRRQRRRRDAREQLIAAWDAFSRLGADAWAQLASRELAATGGLAPGPVRHMSDLLTPQELQVALQVSTGATNREVAGALFLSQKTVEYHLSNAYRRLGVSTRSELGQLLRDRHAATEAAARP